MWDWKRGDEVAAWQSELFDVFPADCDRLLPAINVPDVIAEMLDVPVYEMRHTIWGAPRGRSQPSCFGSGLLIAALVLEGPVSPPPSWEPQLSSLLWASLRLT